MTNTGVHEKIRQLKMQVAALEQAVAADEPAVAAQAGLVEQAAAALQQAHQALLPLLNTLPAQADAVSQTRPGLFVENSPVVLFRWRAEKGWPVDFVTENVNQFGYTPDELLSGRISIAKIVHPDDLERISQEARENVRQGINHFRQTFRIVTKDGAVRWANNWTAVKRNADNWVTHFQGLIIDITEQKQAEALQTKRAAELRCLNDIGQEIERTPPVPQLLQWVAERIPPAMRYPDLCRVAIQFQGQVYGTPAAIDLPAQMTHGLYVGGELLGRVYIAYTEKHDFLDEESALLGAVASRLGGYIENRRLFEQTEAAARREQLLRQVSDRIRGSVDAETIMRTAAREVGKVLGRPAFVYLGNGDNRPAAHLPVEEDAPDE